MRNHIPRRVPLAAWAARSRNLTTTVPPWRPATVLDEWVQKEARPISLRQLTFFARNLTLEKLLTSAEYLREELPRRLAHRLRDMQSLPYAVVTNPHMSHVYELYYRAFEAFRKVGPVRNVGDNDEYCALVKGLLDEHLTIIPRLAMGVLECRDLMPVEDIDRLMYTLLRSRISRRVIAEHHLALTETYKTPSVGKDGNGPAEGNEYVGKVFLKCNAREVLSRCGQLAQDLVKRACSPNCVVPEIELQGHLEATFPYILGHLEYIIGELFRNSIQAVTEHFKDSVHSPPPVKVLVCEAPQHVIFRISDQGGGIPRDVLPHLWSFSKGPRHQSRLQNLNKVPKMAATMQELSPSDLSAQEATSSETEPQRSLTSRPPDLKLGMGLPMSRVYAEYWAGSLDVHSLEDYGTDHFLHISKLGNKNEQLSTRASMDKL